jgi:acetyl/propionyl-CoA carboxylase alpha subunit
VSGIRVERGAASRSIALKADAAELDGRRVPVAVRELDTLTRELALDGVRHRVAWVREGDRVYLWCDGRTWVFSRAKAAGAGAGAEAGGDLRSPMPGRVRRCFAKEGETVTRGQVLLVLEAMKMEHAIRAPRDAVVRAVRVREGDLVEAGVELVEIH